MRKEIMCYNLHEKRESCEVNIENPSWDFKSAREACSPNFSLPFLVVKLNEILF